VRGIKNAVDFVNWIGTIGAFTIWLGPLTGVIGGTAATGIRMVIIDPA